MNIGTRNDDYQAKMYREERERDWNRQEIYIPPKYEPEKPVVLDVQPKYKPKKLELLDISEFEIKQLPSFSYRDDQQIICLDRNILPIKNKKLEILEFKNT